MFYPEQVVNIKIGDRIRLLSYDYGSLCEGVVKEVGYYGALIRIGMEVDLIEDPSRTNQFIKFSDYKTFAGPLADWNDKRKLEKYKQTIVFK